MTRTARYLKGDTSFDFVPWLILEDENLTGALPWDFAVTGYLGAPTMPAEVGKGDMFGDTQSGELAAFLKASVEPPVYIGHRCSHPNLSRLHAKTRIDLRGASRRVRRLGLCQGRLAH